MPGSHDSLLKKRDSLRLKQSQIEVARDKAEAVLRDYFPRISPSDFPHYSEKSRADDENLVASLKAEWECTYENSPEGSIAEGFIFDMIGRRHKWFGQGVEIIRTSEYDDFVNKIDALLQMRVTIGGAADTQYMGLGLDSTTSPDKLREKMRSIVARVTGSDPGRGTLGTVKYAKVPDFIGELRRLPEAVLYIDRDSFNDVVSKWIIPEMAHRQGNDVGEIPEEDMERLNTLAFHQLQLKFLVQIYMQLGEYAKFGKQGVRDRLTATRSVVFKILQDRMATLRVPPEKLPILLTSVSVQRIHKALEEVKEEKKVR